MLTVSTKASEAGPNGPRRLTISVRSEGVSITDSGCTPTFTEPVIAFLPTLIRFTEPSPRDETHRNVPARVSVASSARTIGPTRKSIVRIGVSTAVTSSPESWATNTVCPSRVGYTAWDLAFGLALLVTYSTALVAASMVAYCAAPIVGVCDARVT